jgi:molecular chaperone GrpE
MIMEENKTPEVEENNVEINPENEAPENESEMENDKLNAELKELQDKFLRLTAEFDNYKRRTSRERLELTLTAGKEIVVSLLTVLDDCDRAEKQMKNSEDINLVKEGNLLVFNKLRNILQQKGLVAMESIHTDFDVEKHEAITNIETPEEQKGKVVDELEKGYYLNDKLIRFAKVVVGK